MIFGRIRPWTTPVNVTLRRELTIIPTSRRHETQMEELRSSISTRRCGLEARLKKDQMTIASMEVFLKDKIKENEELSNICDKLVDNTENS